MALSGTTAVWVTAVLCILCTLTVGLRVLARRRRKANLGADDYLLGIALILSWALLVDLVIAVRWGLGQEYIAVFEKYGSAKGILKALMVLEVIYGANLTFVKISILLMYMRIFPTKFFAISTYLISAVLLLWWVAVFILTIFQCTPIAYAYDKTLILSHPGAHCINTNQFYIGNAVPNIVTDIVILSLPVREVWKLQMKLGNKAAVMGMFLLGGFIIVISSIRLVSLFRLDLNNPNVTRDLTVPWIYTSIEPCIAIISACLPTLRPVVALVIPKRFKSTISGSGDDSHISSTSKPLSNTGPFRIFGKAVKGDAENAGSFERLHEGASHAMTPESERRDMFTPKGYASELVTHVSANNNREGTASVEEFPMHTIKMKRGLTWKEEMAP